MAAGLALGATTAGAAQTRIGVLLVNHGSRSVTWRNTLLDLERKTRRALLAVGTTQEVKTAFMEYSEPSIATR